MPQCNHCGASIKSGSKSCEYCGAHVEAGELETRLSYQEAREKRELEEARAKREFEAKQEQRNSRSLMIMAAVCLLLLLALGLYEDWIQPNAVAVPQSSTEFEGRDYRGVKADLQAAGFTSIEASAVPDLKIGFLKKPGEVKEVSINGRTDFSAEENFPSGTRVVIWYHAFPEKE